MTTGNTLRRVLWLSALLIAFCTGARAQVDFTAAAPQRVEAGTAFRVEFTLSSPERIARPSAFTPPAFEGLNVVAGPSMANGQNFSFGNGQRSEIHTLTYTYAVAAPEAGIVTIPAASATVDGKSYSTRPVKIEVVAPGTAAGGQQTAATLQKDDVLVRIVPDRTALFKGEALRVQLKLYFRVDLAGASNFRYPAFNGFWNQEIPVNDAGGQEEYNGKLYTTRVLREFLLFPQQAGVLSIEQFSFSAVARLVSPGRAQSLLDEFFGGGPRIDDIPLDLTAGPIPITVKEWPAGAPAGFGGAVGQFTLEGGPDKAETAANSPANFVLRITGAGNLPLVTAPKPILPASFEQYTVKTEDNYGVSGRTITGTKSFTTPFIPRAEGDYVLPPVEFVYFDPAAVRYVTLYTPEHTMRVGADTGGGENPGLVTGVNREEVKVLGEDIRFIRVGDPKLKRAGGVFLFSWGYWVILLLIVGGFIAALRSLRRRIRRQSDRTLVRNRRARKVALHRLKAAERHMTAKDPAGFYEEMLKVLWGYMGDKLNLPAANLSRDNVREGLAARGVETEWIERYIDAVAECEYRRYAPADNSRIGDVYHAAVELISKMEGKIN